MKLYTRKQLADYFGKSLSTIESWTRGYYIRQGKHILYYTDGKRLEPRVGQGKKNSLTLYSSRDAIEYLQGRILHK